MNFMSKIIESYRLAGLFIIAAFPLFCIPVFFEGLQHVVEVAIGMFASADGIKISSEKQYIRLGFGVFKVLSLLVLLIVVPRFFILGQNKTNALDFSKEAKRSLGAGFLTMILMVIFALVIGPEIVDVIKPDASPVQRALLPLLFITLAGSLLHSKINTWMAKVFDDAPLTLVENKAMNKAMMGGFSPLIILPVLPLFVAHYGLNFFAMGKEPILLFGLLALDSLVVGMLAAVMAAGYYVVYRDARTRQTV